MGIGSGFRDKLEGIVGLKDTPHIIAVSFAVGIFFGVSPLIGLHTVLGLFAAWAFGLNRFVVLSGVYVTNPWSMIPIYTFCTWIGTVLLGVDGVLPEVDWKHLSMGSIVGELGQLVVPFAVGSSVVGLLAAVLCYVIVRRAAEKLRQARSGT